MSIFARTPESDAAWHQLKRNVALGPDAQRSPRKEKRSRELQLLFAGTRQKRCETSLSLIRANTPSPPSIFATRSLT